MMMMIMVMTWPPDVQHPLSSAPRGGERREGRERKRSTHIRSNNPKPGVWDWNLIDDYLDFADKNNITLRIHGPISPQASRWAKADNRTKEELENKTDNYGFIVDKNIFNHNLKNNEIPPSFSLHILVIIYGNYLDWKYLNEIFAKESIDLDI